jgi:Rhodanese-like domain
VVGLPAIGRGGNTLALHYDLLSPGVLAMIASLSRFRRPRVDAPAWIEVVELQRRLAGGDAVVLVDVRQPEEFTAPPGHLPGAVNVPLADLPRRAGELAARVTLPTALPNARENPIFLQPVSADWRISPGCRRPRRARRIWRNAGG